MKRSLIFIFVFFSTLSIRSQSLDSVRIASETIIEFGMNMTGLLNQVIPFKQVTNRTGPYSASLKFIQGRNAFRMGIGMHIVNEGTITGSGDTDILNFNMRLGFERRHIVNSKFVFYQTFDLMMMVGNFNSPINDFIDTDNGGGGLGLGLGIEYYIFENLSLSTEGIGFVGLVGGSGRLITATVIPPVAVFLNYKF